MSYGGEACSRVFQALAKGDPVNPVDREECDGWIRMLSVVMDVYWNKIRYLPPPPPLPNASSSSFQPSVLPWSGMQQVILSELVLDALRRDQPSTTIFGQIRESGAQLEVVQGLLQWSEDTTDFLKAELAMLENDTK